MLSKTWQNHSQKPFKTCTLEISCFIGAISCFIGAISSKIAGTEKVNDMSSLQYCYFERHRQIKDGKNYVIAISTIREKRAVRTKTCHNIFRHFKHILWSWHWISDAIKLNKGGLDCL